MAAAGFFRLYSPPQSCPQTTFLRTEAQGPAVKAGHLDLLPPLGNLLGGIHAFCRAICKLAAESVSSMGLYIELICKTADCLFPGSRFTRLRGSGMGLAFSRSSHINLNVLYTLGCQLYCLRLRSFAEECRAGTEQGAGNHVKRYRCPSSSAVSAMAIQAACDRIIWLITSTIVSVSTRPSSRPCFR